MTLCHIGITLASAAQQGELDAARRAARAAEVDNRLSYCPNTTPPKGACNVIGLLYVPMAEYLPG